MGKLIEKIMDTRQLETGKIMLKYDSIDVNNLLDEATNSLTEWAQNKNINLGIHNSQCPSIDGDPERIYQVITNLISNALKFTPEKGSITITGKHIENNGVGSVEIAVKDTGMGIDKEGLTKNSVIVSRHDSRVLEYGSILFDIGSIEKESDESVDLLKSIITNNYETYVFKEPLLKDEKGRQKELVNNYGFILKDYSFTFCKMELIDNKSSQDMTDEICLKS